MFRGNINYDSFVYMIILLPIYFFILMLATSSIAEEKINLTSGDWKPYISEEFDNYGPYSQIVSEAFALEGITVEYSFFPWKRAVQLAQHGTKDGSIAAVKNPEREKYFFYNETPVLIADRVFFHKKTSGFDWKSIDDLKGMTVGATLEYYYSDDFKQSEEAGVFEVERVPTDNQNMRKLLHDRIDVFPISKAVGYNILKSDFTPEERRLITHHPTPLSSASFHIILSKKIARNKHMLEAFNKGFARLKNSGRYDLILNKIQN